MKPVLSIYAPRLLNNRYAAGIVIRTPDGRTYRLAGDVDSDLGSNVYQFLRKHVEYDSARKLMSIGAIERGLVAQLPSKRFPKPTGNQAYAQSYRGNENWNPGSDIDYDTDPNAIQYVGWNPFKAVTDVVKGAANVVTTAVSATANPLDAAKKVAALATGVAKGDPKAAYNAAAAMISPATTAAKQVANIVQSDSFKPILTAASVIPSPIQPFAQGLDATTKAYLAADAMVAAIGTGDLKAAAQIAASQIAGQFGDMSGALIADGVAKAVAKAGVIQKICTGPTLPQTAYQRAKGIMPGKAMTQSDFVSLMARIIATGG